MNGVIFFWISRRNFEKILADILQIFFFKFVKNKKKCLLTRGRNLKIVCHTYDCDDFLAHLSKFRRLSEVLLILVKICSFLNDF